MKVIRREEHGAEILGLAGRLTAGNGVETLRSMEKALLDDTDHGLVLDLSRVDYIDAAGIGELLRLRRKAMSRGTDLIFSGLTAHVQDVLGVARLSSELDVAADVGEALSRLDRDERPHHKTGPATTTRGVASGDRSHAYRIPVTVAL